MKINVKKYPSNDVFKFIREGINLTQKELAKETGISLSSIEKYETGRQKYTYETLLKIIKTYNLKITMKYNLLEYKSNEIIRVIRKYLNLTQEQFAKSLNISLSSIEKYEGGRQDYPFTILIKIAKRFNLDLIIYE